MWHVWRRVCSRGSEASERDRSATERRRPSESDRDAESSARRAAQNSLVVSYSSYLLYLCIVYVGSFIRCTAFADDARARGVYSEEARAERASAWRRARAKWRAQRAANFRLETVLYGNIARAQPFS